MAQIRGGMFIKIVNQSKNSILINNGQIAKTFLSRAKGLLGTKLLPVGTGLLIVPCKQIHSFGMKFTFDAVFVDFNNKVCFVEPEMRPGRFTKYIKNARYVLELPSGTIEATGTSIGDIIKSQKEEVV